MFEGYTLWDNISQSVHQDLLKRSKRNSAKTVEVKIGSIIRDAQLYTLWDNMQLVGIPGCTENEQTKLKRQQKYVNWCFTPSQPAWLYQGERLQK